MSLLLSLRLLPCLLLCLPAAAMAASVSAMQTQPLNHLASESSPYLLQHAHNPVNWYPWGKDAFDKARREDKPILLSIGYSTCHWCHVMEEESFSDAEVAAVLNDAVIAIKVDREERPDIDQVYMQAAQMMGVHGGWPLNVLMTPDKQPFFAATYLPKSSRAGRIGLIELVEQIDKLWRHDRKRLLLPAAQLGEAMQKLAQNTAGGEVPNDLKEQVFSSLHDAFDMTHGGFGSAPKFPSPHKLLFLLRYWHQSGDDKALTMVTQTLTAMRNGGIFDQLGYGFHRYSTDDEWLLPHFEKMLYDQAMLLMAYSEGFQASGDEHLGTSARALADYVLRMMQAPEGGFYSAEDADSDGEEGRFYFWRQDELADVLGKDDAAFAAHVFGITQAGNIRDEATGRQTGGNVLYLAKPPATARDRARLETVRNKLFAAREKRIHPFRDNKQLTDWNGLMIAALAIAGRVLDEPRYSEAATRAADFLLSRLRDTQGRLLHRYLNGKAGIRAHLDDYAFLIWGLIELYETGLDAGYLKAAITLNEDMLVHFSSAAGGLYFTAGDAETLPARLLDAFDGALPSGNSVAMMNLLRLARMSDNSELEKRAATVASAFASDMQRAPAAFIWMAAAQMRASSPGFEIVLAGNPDSQDAKRLLAALHSRYLPNSVLLWSDDAINNLAPFTKGQKARNGVATAYVCRDYRCNLPVSDAKEMLKLLEQR